MCAQPDERMRGRRSRIGERERAEEGGLSERLARLQGARLYRFAGLLFLLALVFRYLDSIFQVLLIAFVGAIIGVALNAVVKRVPLPRKVAVAVIAVVLLGGIGAGAWLGFSALVGQVQAFVEEFPTYVEGAEAWLQDVTGLDLELFGPRVAGAIEGLFGTVDGAAVIAGAFGVVEILAVTILVLVGAFFVVAKPNEQLLNPLLRAIPEERRPAFRRLLHRMGERLSAWLWGTLISMLVIGALAIVAFYVLGTPYPLLLGAIVGITDIVPLVGPWIGGIVAVLVTLVADPGQALWVAVAILVIQEVEGNLVRPLTMSSAARIHPFVTLLALLLFTSLFGVLGAILSLPLTLALGTIVEVFWVEEALGAGADKIEPAIET